MPNTVGAVLVVGGGIDGIQSALGLATTDNDGSDK